jgi:DNA helicase II / ATP-dependent DNA helicase PcrA
LLTLHASKGLEFKYVIIAGCEDGLMPYSINDNIVSDTEEEKRLLYVGMTRAKTNLILSHSEHRVLYGKELNLPVSPFLNNIGKEYADKHSTEKLKKSKIDSSQLNLF